MSPPMDKRARLRRLSSSASLISRPRPGPDGTANLPSAGFGGLAKAGCMRRRRVGEFGRLGQVHDGRQHVQVGDVADGRLRLVRHQLDAMRVADRRRTASAR